MAFKDIVIFVQQDRLETLKGSKNIDVVLKKKRR